MTRFISWLLLFLLFGTFAGVAFVVLQRRAAAGREMPRWSVYAEDADGLAETARFVAKLGWEPVALTRPVVQLPTDPTQPRLVVMVEPQPPASAFGGSGEMGKGEAQAILDWAAQGNTLLLVGRHAAALHDALGVVLSSDLNAAAAETARPVAVAEAGGYTAGVERLLVEGRDEVLAGAGLPLWWLDDRPAALVLRRGQGRIILVPDASLFTRRGLLREDSAIFLYNIVRLHARDGRVYFDEYHHGLRAGGGFWAYLHHHRQHWTLLAVLLTAGTAAWGVMVRQGPAVPAPTPAQADAVDYASALARIYQRAGLRRLLGQVAARQFLAALRQHLRLRPSAPPAEVRAAWQQRHPGDRSVERLLEGAAAVNQPAVTERQLLAWTRAFDRFRAEQQTSAPTRRAGGVSPPRGSEPSEVHTPAGG